MGRGTRFLESPATPEEDSFRYRVEWDDVITDNGEYGIKLKIIHLGPGSRDVSGFDNAWDAFNDLKRNPDVVRPRLIRIYDDGTESVYASK